MRLIDLDVAIKDARANYGDVHDAVIMEHFLNAQPTLDAAPVVHGRWVGESVVIYSPCLNTELRECSHCHKVRTIDEYCSACGTKMDLPEDVE